MDIDRARPHRPSRRPGAWLAAALLISATYSCSLLIENRSEQCQSDADCSDGFKCETGAHVCVAGEASSSSSSSSGTSSSSSSSSSGGVVCDVDGGVSGGGCWNCEPTSEPEIINHCTDAQCFPFDNAARVAALADGGKLPPLPDGGP